MKTALPRRSLFLAFTAIAAALSLGALSLHAWPSASAPAQPPAAVDSQAPHAAPTLITLDDFQKIVADRTALILDARPEQEFADGHVPHAVNFPRYRAKKSLPALESSLNLSSRQTIVVYCCSKLCPDSETVAALLVDAGFTHVLLFKGGMYDWQTHGLAQEH